MIVEHVTQRYRNKYLKSLLHHDISVIEMYSPGTLGQRFSEESTRMVNGLGPSLGMFVRSVTSLLCGLVLGFYYVGDVYAYHVELASDLLFVTCLSLHSLF